MKNFLFTILVLLIFSCRPKSITQTSESKTKIDELFRKKIEHSLISRGDNFPDFDYTQDSLDLFLFALHENIPVSEFMDKTGFSKSKIKEMQKFLESKNWLHFKDGDPKPSIFIATQKEGETLFEYSVPIANEIVEQIEGMIPKLKQQFSQTEISEKQGFEEWSFLILSNVLLDSWQIDHVESEFLKTKQRPQRHGKNYYYSIMENAENSREAFGIYGNQYDEKNGESYSIYGNNRIGVTDVLTENYISASDNKILNEMAENFKPSLLHVLNNNFDYLNRVYRDTGYENEISFEEFFIWWYHFIYTKATDIMKEKKMLVIPESGNFEYVVEG